MDKPGDKSNREDQSKFSVKDPMIYSAKILEKVAQLPGAGGFTEESVRAFRESFLVHWGCCGWVLGEVR